MIHNCTYQAGVEASVDIYQGLYHAFYIIQPRLNESKEAARKFEAAFIYAKGHYFRAQAGN